MPYKRIQHARAYDYRYLHTAPNYGHTMLFRVHAFPRKIIIVIIIITLPRGSCVVSYRISAFRRFPRMKTITQRVSYRRITRRVLLTGRSI